MKTVNKSYTSPIRVGYCTKHLSKFGTTTTKRLEAIRMKWRWVHYVPWHRDSNDNTVVKDIDNNHDKYYDAYHELKDAAIALVERLELDKDVKKNNWWLNERAERIF